MAKTVHILRLLLVVLTSLVVTAWGDDEDGPPISIEEIEEALGNPDLLKPPPGDEDAIENSGQYEGDIMLTENQKVQMTKSRSAISNTANLWVNGVIPYTISSVFNRDERQVIARAMAEYAAKTCIRFVARTSHKDYIHIKSDSGCFSYIGSIGGRQDVSLERPGCVYFGTVIHEFMHASGFYHEQSRWDRDDFVTINFGNIKPGFDGNFKKASKDVITHQGLAYDYGSVMHYPEKAFTKNGQPTIISKKPGVTLGQRKGFSELDVNGLNLLYKCKGTECIDRHNDCKGWADTDQCDKYPEYMKINCPKSCDLCGGGGGGGGTDCIDKNDNCKGWADTDQCDKYPEYMKTNCPKACGLCGGGGGKCKFIELTANNINSHGGIGPAGAGPEHLLIKDGYWNPNPKPWFVIFDLTKTYKVNKVKLINQGDTTHDVKSFSLETSNDNRQWKLVDTITNVATGTEAAQYFIVSGEGRYWKLTIRKTASDFQPWLRFFSFCGEKGTTPVKKGNLRPIIGILAQEPGKKMKQIVPKYKSYIAASYVKFIESGGARVVPIMIDQKDSYYEDLVKNLNGIVFPGGGASITSSSGYGRAGRKLYDLVLESGRKGNPIPLWATCLGFEMLMYLAADGPTKYEVLTSCKASDISLPLILKDWKKSKFMGSAPESVVAPLTSMDITSNFHKYCVTPQTFVKYGLNNDYTVISNNFDTNGLEFISTVEHKTLPIYGQQWHPEKNMFEWKYSSISHTPEAIHVGLYFAQFFGDQARKNSNSFSSRTEERKHLIYNYNPIYLTPFKESHDYYSSFHQAYFFE
ncbi:unnamed protein product [Meganyctiphanes norvegica]|uniref:Metalloendopeptidase n=1 Tax=Meganyctiphanes norvegica TaxID=48144 RepID=A0AAV2PTK9_MEGNR